MKDAGKEKTAMAASQLDVEKGETSKKAQSSSAPRKQQKGKLKKLGMSTKPKDILDTFQNWNLAPAEWGNTGGPSTKQGSTKSGRQTERKKPIHGRKRLNI